MRSEVKRQPISKFIALNGPLIDVRSPAEYAYAHIPGALSIPLFSDEERAVVGTNYKQVSRELAIKKGLDFFGPKMRLIVEAVENLESDVTAHLRVYCWRGGMRSDAIAWLLNLYGYEVDVLEGGYKGYRRTVLESFESNKFKFIIIGGYTGCGKTRFLKSIQDQYAVLDFEGLANHKGSAFGHLGHLVQPSQEMFENLVVSGLVKLYDVNGGKPIVVEDESQRIGNISIPRGIWNNMLMAPIIFVDLPYELRLRNIVNEYAHFDKTALIAAVSRISKRLGPQHAKEVSLLIDNDQIEEGFDILLKYYDRLYEKNLSKRLDANSSVVIERLTVPDEITAKEEVLKVLEKWI